jgi:hypothetical protein
MVYTMRLKYNKEYIIEDRVFDRISWKENNIWNSNNNIWFIQNINIYRVITSNFLIHIF